MPGSYVLLEEADSDDDAAYNGTNCSYEWRSLKAPTIKGFLLKFVVFITKTPLWGPVYFLFASRSGLFKVCCSSVLASSDLDLCIPFGNHVPQIYPLPTATVVSPISTHVALEQNIALYRL
jgi:hypothetical protein